MGKNKGGGEVVIIEDCREMKGSWERIHWMKKKKSEEESNWVDPMEASLHRSSW